MLILIYFLVFSSIEVMGQERERPYKINNRVDYAPGYVCNFELRMFNDAFLLYTCVPAYKCKAVDSVTKSKRSPHQIGLYDNCHNAFNPPPGGGNYVCCHPEDNEEAPQTPVNGTHPPFDVKYMPGFRSIFKCNDYKTLLCFNKDYCPQSRRRLVVKGGTETNIEKYPHIAVIGWYDRNTFEQDWFCLGSIVSDRFVLSAASCRKDSKGEVNRVRVGENKICNLEGAVSECESVKESQLFNIILRTLHPGAEEDWYYHDLMLLKVDRDIRFNSHVRPACLFTEMNTFQSNGMFALYEDANYEVKGKAVHTIREMEIEVQSADDCDRHYANDTELSRGTTDPDIMFCAGLPDRGKVPCQGDYGGPLQIQEDVPYCMWKIYGVMARTNGVTCGGRKAALFTRLPFYIGWIEDQVWPDWTFDMLKEYGKSTEVCALTLPYKTPLQDVEEGRCLPY